MDAAVGTETRGVSRVCVAITVANLVGGLNLAGDCGILERMDVGEGNAVG